MSKKIQAPKPISRKDAYFAHLSGEVVELPSPVSTLDHYLYNMCVSENQGGGVSTVTSENITDATQIGKALLKAPNKLTVQQTITSNADIVAFLGGSPNATNQENIRALIGAKASDYVPSWNEITSKPSEFTPVVATTDTIGGVKKMGRVADSTAESVATLVNDFNALLNKLKLAGIME